MILRHHMIDETPLSADEVWHGIIHGIIDESSARLGAFGVDGPYGRSESARMAQGAGNGEDMPGDVGGYSPDAD
jgi:hypothetical protein